MRLRRPKAHELLSIIAFLIVLAGCVWYLVTSHLLFGGAEVSTHGQIARALGIGLGVVLALGLNIAFIVLARRQTADEESEDKTRSSDPFNHK
ncbi:MAG: hypothetical protein KI792_11610 [Alphaproteobacteria bacterium]|nr:hypothetical protein [Alphaproteobacteria bacterium SS10]